MGESRWQRSCFCFRGQIIIFKPECEQGCCWRKKYEVFFRSDRSTRLLVISIGNSEAEKKKTGSASSSEKEPERKNVQEHFERSDRTK